MISNLYFQVQSLVVILIIIIMYMTKPKIKTKETEIYKQLIFTGLSGVLFDISSTYLAHIDVNNFFVTPLCKLFLINLIYFTFLLGKYILIVTFTKKASDKVLLVYKGITLLASIVVVIFPLYNHVSNGEIYTYGPSASVMYVIVASNILLYILFLFTNKKNIVIKKYYPIMIFAILVLFAAIIQSTNPEILIVSTVTVMVLLIMYFTIENPDIKMIEMLNKARQEADNANNAKTEFLSNMSHEIRTPLNAIVGFSQALEEEDLSEDAKKEVEDIITSSNNLLELVNGILDISKIEANKLEIINTEYEFKKLFNELVTLAKIRLKDKDIEFNFTYDDSVPNVLYGDRIRVKQIILNILTNACKYTKQGSIDFKINSIKKNDVCRLIISVQDTGIGIKESNVSKLFDKFERFDLEKNITIEGTGLGLAITKKLIDLMHGKIIVQSVYGVGSRFTISLDQKIVNKTCVTVETITNEELKDMTGKKVLVVDDNKMNLKVAQRLLRKYNLDLHILDNGTSCLDEIHNGVIYDLILMDDMMPNMTGTETLHKLKENENFKIPTVALTANAISGMKEKYIQEGFDDYLSKPIDKYELENILNKYL